MTQNGNMISKCRLLLTEYGHGWLTLTEYELNADNSNMYVQTYQMKP